MNARIEYEIPTIRHIAVQCPECKNWFEGREITSKSIHTNTDAKSAVYKCPICGFNFSGNFEKFNIKECGSSTEVYENCLRRKVVWE